MRKNMVMAWVTVVLLSGCWKQETSAPHASFTLDVRGQNTRDIPASEFADGWSVHYERFALSPTFGVDETFDNRKGDGYQPIVGSDAYWFGGARLELTEPAAVPELDGWVIAGRSGGWGMHLRSVPEKYDPPDYSRRTSGRPALPDEASAPAGTSLDVAGAATSPDGQVIRFAWQFTYELTFSHCLPVGTQTLVLPEDGELDLHVALDGAALFGDQLAPGAQLRFEALAQADVDQDGTITNAELSAAALEQIDRASEQYSGPGATSLHDFLSARLAYLVAPEYTCEVGVSTVPG